MEIKTHRSVSELAQIRDFWVRTQSHPNSDYEHFLLVCEGRAEVLSPCVISLWQEGQCQCLIVGRRERLRLQPTIGYARLPGPWATVLTFVHSGIIGTLDSEGAKVAAAEIGELLRTGYADVVAVNRMHREEPLMEALRSLRSGRAGTSLWSTHRELTLQTDPGFLLKAMRPKHRYWVKRKEKELAANFPGESISWCWYADAQDLLSLCKRVEVVAKDTYQRGLGGGFVDTSETRARLALFAGRGQLRVFLMEINGEPKAFWIGNVYRGVFHSSDTGYAQDLRTFEVGTLLFLRMVDKLVEEGVTKLDFGLGDAQYKQRFGDRAWEEETIKLFARTVKGTVIGAYCEACDYLDRTARRTVMRLGVTDRIKQLWRARLRTGEG